MKKSKHYLTALFFLSIAAMTTISCGNQNQAQRQMPISGAIRASGSSDNMPRASVFILDRETEERQHGLIIVGKEGSNIGTIYDGQTNRFHFKEAGSTQGIYFDVMLDQVIVYDVRDPNNIAQDHFSTEDINWDQVDAFINYGENIEMGMTLEEIIATLCSEPES